MEISKILEEQKEKAFKYDCLVKKINKKIEELSKIEQQAIADMHYITVNARIQVLKELLGEE